MNPEIVKIVNEKGVLLEKELFELLNNFKDITAAKSFLDRLTTMSGQKIITSANLVKNMEYAQQIINTVPGEMKSLVEKTFVTLGISLSIEKHTEVKSTLGLGYQVFYSDTKNSKKVEVGDFVGHFRSRYQQIQRILLQRADAQNLISINKLSGVRQNISIIGMLTEKKITGNKNLMMTFEDLTGSIKVLVKLDSECYASAAEIQLDDVVFIRGAGSKDFMYAYEIIFPDSFKEKVRFDGDSCIAFVSDVHAGSLKHLGKEFERFLEWINSEDEMAKKIKFIFFVGDNVDGVGVFPGQERLLNLKSLREQYELLASYLKRIPKDITLFMCPGQHDSVRVAEPQPIIDDFYGKPLREIENLVLVSNPSMIKLMEKDKEFKILMYHGASIHAFINEIQELRLMKAHKSPAKAVKHMLKRRHLAPSHGVSPSIVYVPNVNKDPLVISEVPDILCTGEVHRPDIETYNGTLIITGSCWQAQTEFEEKVGNVPDPCKVPVFNLKTRELKLLDFSL